MKNITALLIVAAIVATGACKKRKYPPEQQFVTEEIFRMEATIGNESVDLRAGSDGYYCHSSVEQGVAGVYSFVSELKKFGCDDCPRSFFLQINDIQNRSAGATVLVDSVIRPGRKDYAVGSDYARKISFQPFFNKAATAWKWNFGDGSSSSAQSPEHGFVFPGKYNVCLNASSGSCNDESCSSIALSESGDVFFARVQPEQTGERSARFSAITQGDGPFIYTWHMGDGAVYDQQVVTHEYKWPGSYPVKLIVRDGAGNSVETQYNYVTDGDASSCAAGFALDSGNVVHAGLGRVRIRWTDSRNRLFSSDLVQQPGESYFEITGVEEFDANEYGDPTKLVTMRINVLLSDGTQEMWLRTDNAVLAVAYK